MVPSIMLYQEMHFLLYQIVEVYCMKYVLVFDCSALCLLVLGCLWSFRMSFSIAAVIVSLIVIVVLFWHESYM
jgi:hypothetical protein